MADVYAGWKQRYEQEPKAMRAGWRNLLGQPIFPRDIVFPIAGAKAKKFQRSARNLTEFYAVIEENAPKGPLWAGWSPTGQYDMPGMDRIFGDIDSIDLEDALQRARRYEDWCIRNFDVEPATIFTCGKGFHQHFTMDYVEGLGTAFSDAYLTLVQGSGSSPDPQPLKHRKTYPRLPYCMNLKATGEHRKPMFTVPVDLTWSLKEILQASTEIRVSRFEVPHSPTLAALMQPLVDRNLKEEASKAKWASEKKTGMHDDLVRSAIAFSEEVGWKLVDAMGRPDGRRRVLSMLYIPALMWECDGDQDRVEASVEAWVELAGGAWNDYRMFTRGTMKTCILREGGLRHPVGLRRFWQENSELQVPS